MKKKAPIRFRISVKQSDWQSYVYPVISFAFALAWLVAVVKVFLLESHPNFTNTSPDVNEHIKSVKSVDSKSSHRVHVHHHINITSKSLHNVGKKHVIKIGNATVKAADLKWPPVNLDGSIPSNEGFDVMPLTKLKVPRFWSPPGVLTYLRLDLR